MFRILLIILVLCPELIPAQTQFQTQSVTIFKTGQAFYHQRVTAPLTDGRVDDLLLPETTPALGTVGFHGFGNDILSYRTYQNEREEALEPLRFNGPVELLGANIGNEVILTDVANREIRGVISSISTLNQETGPIIMLETGGGFRMISLALVSGFTFGQGGILRQENRSRTITENYLSMAFERPAAEATIDLTYLTDQLVWVPQYQAHLLTDGLLRLQLFATIMNDRAPLEDVQLNLAVGQPEFLFSRMHDPLFSRQSVRDFLNQLNRGSGSSGPIAPSLMQNVITSQRASVMEEGLGPTISAALNDADLYFFNIQHFSLEQGHTAKIRLLELDAEYSSIYTCNLNSRTGPGNTYRVEHALRFRNTSEHPLTTGIVMFHNYDSERGFEPIGQQQLDFIAPGAMGQVPLSIATEVVVDQEERIGERFYDQQRERHYRDYDITFKISNYKEKPVVLRLRRSVSGYLLESQLEVRNISDGIMGQGQRSHYYDRSNNYEWEIELNPGETIDVESEFRIWN